MMRIDTQGITALLHEVNLTHGSAWVLVERLAGGHQSGACRLRDAISGQPAVLKVSEQTEWAQQVTRAAPIIEAARTAGWPTPAWLAVGTTTQGWPYEIQEWVDGTPMDRLGLEEAEMILELLDTQVGIGAKGPQDWSEYNRQVVFADRYGFAGEVRGSSPEGAEIVASVSALCDPYRSLDLPVTDLVHGDLSTHNILVKDGRIAGVVDVEAVGCGSRVSDLACVIREGYMWRGDQAALERLLSEGLVMAGVGALLISIAATVFGVSAFVLDHSPSEWPHAASGALELARILGEV